MNGNLKRIENPNLGDEDDVGLGLANTAAAIVADEAEASDAGGANIPMAAGTIGHPFKSVGADGTAIVHGCL